MAEKSIKVSFTLDASDVAHFRKLYREAQKNTSPEDEPRVVEKVRKLIAEVRAAKKAPSFVIEAVHTLEDLLQMIDDEDWSLPRPVANKALAALAYFADPADLIPDSLPGLGFLDDAIMMKFVEEEFKNELWGYRKFRKYRDGAEQRPWTSVARKRLPERLEAYRKEMRAKIKAREAKVGGRPAGW